MNDDDDTNHAQLPPWTIEVAWRILAALGYPYNRDDRPEVADWHRADMAQLLARIVSEAAAGDTGRAQAIAVINDWRKWYDEKLFSPLEEGETQKVHALWPGLVDRIAAESARNSCDQIIKELATSAVPDEKCPGCGHERHFFEEPSRICTFIVGYKDEFGNWRKDIRDAKESVRCSHRCDFSRPAPQQLRAIERLHVCPQCSAACFCKLAQDEQNSLCEHCAMRPVSEAAKRAASQILIDVFESRGEFGILKEPVRGILKKEICAIIESEFAKE